MGNSYNRKPIEWVEIESTGCWECTSHCKRSSINGYADISINGKSMLMHRFIYDQMFGLAEGMHVLHKCDNSKCINPEHLYLGTHKDNMQDKKDRKRCNPPKGESNKRHKLTRSQVLEIRDQLSSGIFERVIAEKYGVTQVLISRIKLKKVWAWL